MTMARGFVSAALAAAVAACSFESGEGDFEVGVEPLAETAQELSRLALTREQAATVLDAIDDICGDTWCEGDHDFSFDRLECSPGCPQRAGSCRLTFRVFSYDTDITTGPTYTRSCRTQGFTGFDSLVATYGDYHSLQPDYYAALSDCISRVEERLPP